MDLVLEFFEEGSAEGRLTGADLSRDFNKPAAGSNSVDESGEGFEMMAA